MCHAPIVVPAVGRGEARNCRRTTRAMREIAARVIEAKPDRIVLLSPHSPRRHGSWGIWKGPRHRGDLGAFRAPEIAVDLPDAPEVNDALGLPTIPAAPLDHGAMVPLAFLWEAGWRGPTAILALPWEDEPWDQSFGSTIAQIAGRTAVVASGDMSHRLKRGAPAGYHPDAASFDRAFVEALERHDWPALADLPHRENAAEDVVTSTCSAQTTVGGPRHDEVLSYEGPWGVGYTEAILFDERPALYAVARRAVRAHLRGERVETSKPGDGAPGVFVTLHEGTALKGCVGHVDARPSEDLHAAIADVAIAAATRDPRFDSLTLEELPDLTFEVSLLSEQRPLTDRTVHDPRARGLVVEAGRRRGLLLPDVDTIESIDEQERVCRKKAGIGSSEPATLSWFTVLKVSQPA